MLIFVLSNHLKFVFDGLVYYFHFFFFFWVHGNTLIQKEKKIKNPFFVWDSLRIIKIIRVLALSESPDIRSNEAVYSDHEPK